MVVVLTIKEMSYFVVGLFDAFRIIFVISSSLPALFALTRP